MAMIIIYFCNSLVTVYVYSAEYSNDKNSANYIFINWKYTIFIFFILT